MNKALFLDRDGTLNYERDYITNPDDLELIPGVREGLIKAIEKGYRLFILTNQSGIGKGLHTLEVVEAVNKRLFEMLDLPEPGITETCIATETARDPLIYRKPSPRFLNEKIQQYELDRNQCYMFGDRLSDLLCGLNAGVIPIYLRSGYPLDVETSNFLSVHWVRAFDDLADALKVIL